MTLFQRTLQPILGPMPHLPWASGAVFNPGAWRTDDGTVHLLFRAIPEGYRKTAKTGQDPYEGPHNFSDYVSYIGYAASRDGVTFDVREEPFILPDTPWDRYGAEDARVVGLGGTHYITYTALRAPAFGDEEGVGIGLASTEDFRSVTKHGLVGPLVRDKDAVIFPQRIGGRIAMLHRVVPDIQIAYFDSEEQLQHPGERYWDDYLACLDEYVVMRPEATWEGKKIGAGPTPIETPEGWLLFYHGADWQHVYRTGLALLDRDDPTRILARTRRPVFAPETEWEREGDVPNVVFPQGTALIDGILHVYYGAADRCVGHATAPLTDVLDHLREEENRAWRMPQVFMLSQGLEGPEDFRTTPVVPVERLHGGQPVLEPVPGHPWESRVVLNPAAVLVQGTDLEALLPTWGLTGTQAQRLRDAGGACVLLYRAQGSAFDRDGHKASSLGLAYLTPDLELVHRCPDPVLAPDAPEHDLGVEDPRCTKVGDTYYLYYTGYAREKASASSDLHGRVRICLATSQNLAEWTLHGPVGGDVNDVPNKNAVLLPEPVGGRWRLLHRPMAGRHPMAMHLAESDSPAGPWRSRGLLMASHRFGDYSVSWVGAAGPPEPLGDGRFVSLYHQGHFDFDRSRLYNLSAMLLDFTKAQPVRARL
ncbi:MAG TPA: glycosidase, partial [Rhodothermales bacterium]|nr:glycosidase [Rhodothermales bacterium]